MSLVIEGKMAVTGKQKKYGIESFFLVPKGSLTKLVPNGLSLFSRFGSKNNGHFGIRNQAAENMGRKV
jgi:hypothetical protein